MPVRGRTLALEQSTGVRVTGSVRGRTPALEQSLGVQVTGSVRGSVPGTRTEPRGPDGKVQCKHSPGEARAMQLVCIVSCQIGEMEASRVEDQGGQVDHVAAR